MKILFMGTPDFAVGCMRALCEAGYDVCGAVSQPDRPRGRGHKLQPTPVHEYADSLGIPVYQPEKIKNGEMQEILDTLCPDVIVVVAYGKILPEYILNYPKYGCINVHASLLPKYRGAAPIQWSIVNGETETGVTTMYMEKGLDTGDMILKSVVKIESDETASSLHDKLMESGGKLICETLEKIKNGEAVREKQNDDESTYAPMIDKSTALIDWQKSATEVFNLVRGMNSYPYAYTYYEGKMMKIGICKVTDDKAKPGEIVKVSPDGVEVGCKDGSVLISTLQFEGKKMMSVRDYLAGNEIKTGILLG